MKRKKLSYTVGANVNWYSYYGEHYGGCLKIELPCDSAILLLEIYPEKKNKKQNMVQKDTCALFYLSVHCSTVYKSQYME